MQKKLMTLSFLLTLSTTLFASTIVEKIFYGVPFDMPKGNHSDTYSSREQCGKYCRSISGRFLRSQIHGKFCFPILPVPGVGAMGYACLYKENHCQCSVE